MFDIWEHPYSPVGEAFIREQTHLHPERLTIVKGSSLKTVKAFHAANPTYRCDLISIDGGHTFDIGVQDMENMRFLANPMFNILLVDDTNCDKEVPYCVDEVLREHQRRNTIRVYEGFGLHDGYRGVTVMSYLRDHSSSGF
jgi:hypothetical protein